MCIAVKKENEVLVPISLDLIILLIFFIPSIGPEAAFLWLCEALLQTEADRPAMQLHVMSELRHQETNCSKTAAKLKSFTQVCLYFPNEHKKKILRNVMTEFYKLLTFSVIFLVPEIIMQCYLPHLALNIQSLTSKPGD